MTSLAHNQVFQSLSSSPHARLLHGAELGDDLAAALWTNHHDARDYQGPSQHTLSCYLAGGTGTFRRERPGSKGAPDKLCILPAGHESSWVINGEICLAHLYVSPERFAASAVTLLDREPRELQLRESTFLDDPQLAGQFRQLVQLDWKEPGERLLGSSLAHEMISHVLLTQVGLRQGLKVKGGLAPHLRRRLAEYIEQHLDQSLSLGELAQLAALSEYHFVRMFRASFGLPPHRYVLQRRLLRARQLLQHSRLPLGEIALACGFASASHFSNRFRAVFGAAPGLLRAAAD
ncbi:helix-turn-helix domain-containing protein [Aquipseudomonas guryensis]|uniref:Helix-turn-helix transcriptional regulator n=1 Tax=Aquipseudomonas guryensis TaxID=2759165 RepID=A0A7W4DCL9_9GAMM|nr:AraC family transcriptional regulator [Pseudomonas guryensis]MBB1520070.1 helix-turn-helix transcriptional regulator [Pseudomonas guryensis]